MTVKELRELLNNTSSEHDDVTVAISTEKNDGLIEEVVGEHCGLIYMNIGRDEDMPIFMLASEGVLGD